MNCYNVLLSAFKPEYKHFQLVINMKQRAVFCHCNAFFLKKWENILSSEQTIALYSPKSHSEAELVPSVLLLGTKPVGFPSVPLALGHFNQLD